MSVATVRPVSYADSASLARFSVARYQQMIETGVITTADRVELLENYVVLKMPGNPPHDGTMLRIQKRLGRRLPPGWDIRNQTAVALGDSQPEPDLAVVREDSADYTTRHPSPADIGFVVEVADSSLLRDQRDKTRIYARAGVPIYWIVNLVDRRVEVYSDPSGAAAAPDYATVRHHGTGQDVPVVLGGTTVATIPVAELLP